MCPFARLVLLYSITAGLIGVSCCSGRVDDVINVSGHRVGTAEVEGALVSHDVVDEAAVCG